jgi:hypothetical protein
MLQKGEIPRPDRIAVKATIQGLTMNSRRDAQLGSCRYAGPEGVREAKSIIVLPFSAAIAVTLIDLHRRLRGFA